MDPAAARRRFAAAQAARERGLSPGMASESQAMGERPQVAAGGEGRPAETGLLTRGQATRVIEKEVTRALLDDPTITPERLEARLAGC